MIVCLSARAGISVRTGQSEVGAAVAAIVNGSGLGGFGVWLLRRSEGRDLSLCDRCAARRSMVLAGKRPATPGELTSRAAADGLADLVTAVSARGVVIVDGLLSAAFPSGVRVMIMSKRDKALSWPSDVVWPDDRAFRDMFRDLFSGSAMRDRFAEGFTNPMHLEEFVDGDMGVIRVEMPGIDPDKDVDINVTNGVLNVRAHREERKEEDRPDGYRSEFRYGRFQRSIRLPEGTTESDIKASYKDGILEVRVPITAAAQAEPTKISIERA